MLANDQSQPQSFWVIVPTYNPGKDEWAQWLRALKAQVCQPQKVIVVDSGSVDGTQTLTQAEGHSCLEINAKDFDTDAHKNEVKKMFESGQNIYIDGWTASINMTLQQYKSNEKMKIVY
jgi:GT2 family glycosyltransferase